MPPSPAPPTPLPLEALWSASTLAWIIMIGEALAMAMSLAPGIDADRLILFGLNSLAIQWTALLCLGLLYLLRGNLQRCQPTTVAISALGALLVATLATYILLWLALHDTISPPAGGWPQLLFHMTALALIFGLLGLAAFQNHWRNRLLALQAKQAELDALRARVDPHFLFNALNSAVSLVRTAPADSERLLMDLADLFRAALSRTATVSLLRELELSRQYLDIEALRFGERLQLNWNVPPGLPNLDIPSLSLQPLMENAIRHGLEPRAEGGVLRVEVQVATREVTIVICNPCALPGSTTEGHRLGLSSTRSRLEAHFDGRATVENSTVGDVYQTIVRLPLD